jgi:hypothetical protein
MLYLGFNLTQSHREKLSPVSLETLYQMISSPSPELKKLVAELEKIHQLDQDAFNRHKIRLPFFCGSEFSEGLRNCEQFIQASYFVLDIDHCFEVAQIDKETEWKEKLKTDQRIALMYTSPSGTGLKIVFRISPPIVNTKRFADFYLAFAGKFSAQYHLEKYIDFKTHDVTRVSFLNSDAMAFFNPSHVPVDPEKYYSSYDIFASKTSPVEDIHDENHEKKKSLDEETYQEILQTLNPKTPKRKKNYIIPAILDSIVEPLQEALHEKGIEVLEVLNIHYGKKFRMKLEGSFAEINIYYGKNGFSVVKTPKSDINEILNEIAYQIAIGVIFEFEHHQALLRLHEELIKPPETGQTNPLLN